MMNIIDQAGIIFVFLSFAIMLVLIFQTRSYWYAQIREISSVQWVCLSLILAISVWLRFVFFKPRHIMYVDEFWYMEAARNLITYGQIGAYPKSLGWPMLLSIIFFIKGVGNFTAIYASAILGALTFFNIFLLTSIIYNNRWLGIISAALFSILPGHILWSVTAETNVPALYFITLTMFFVFLYYKHKASSLLWASLFSIGFIAQIRPENHIFFLLFIFGIFIFVKPLPKINFNYLEPWALSFFLTLPDIIRVLRDKLSNNWLEAESNGLIHGSNFSLSNLLYNSQKWGGYLFTNVLHPIFFTLLFLLGCFYCYKYYRKCWKLLILWVVIFYLVYFTAWFQTLGGSTELYGKIRFYLSFYPVLVIFAAGGIYLLGQFIRSKIFRGINDRGLICALITIMLMLNFLPYMKERRDYFKELELGVITKISKDFTSKDLFVINLPPVLGATTNVRTCALKDFLENDLYRRNMLSSTGRVFFLDDYTCTICDDFKKDCGQIKRDFDLVLFKEFKSDQKTLPQGVEDYTINLYQVYIRK
ncbi:MAG: glycosyltransferase family 39 protein [Candidatus Omnitrophica bacterium]|nr:glycosyltransferase family 39 protein [Candidatus Omnitrophota bacterium]